MEEGGEDEGKGRRREKSDVGWCEGKESGKRSGGRVA